jgi:hypothetical protein
MVLCFGAGRIWSSSSWALSCGSNYCNTFLQYFLKRILNFFKKILKARCLGIFCFLFESFFHVWILDKWVDKRTHVNVGAKLLWKKTHVDVRVEFFSRRLMSMESFPWKFLTYILYISYLRRWDWVHISKCVWSCCHEILDGHPILLFCESMQVSTETIHGNQRFPNINYHVEVWVVPLLPFCWWIKNCATHL